MLGPRFGNDHWCLLAGRSDADQSAAVDFLMAVEDRLAGDRVQRALRRDDAMGLASAEPEAVRRTGFQPALSGGDTLETCPTFEIPDVPHPVPETSVAVANLVQRVAIRARHVLGRDHRPLHDQLADLAAREHFRTIDRGDRLVGDADDLPLDAREPPADAGPLPCPAPLGRFG